MRKLNRSPFSCCALCGSPGPLENSHIIPAFVFRWLKETSGTGYLRSAEAINRRVQDGLILPMLCGACEDRFSPWESDFAARIFYPFTSDQLGTVTFGESARKFAVSVSWRVLTLIVRDGTPPIFQTRARKLESCLATWKDYLLGNRADPGHHHVHLIRWNGVIGGTTHPDELPPNLNRYLSRIVEMQDAASPVDAFVFVKIGPIQIVGMIDYPGPHGWPTTLVDPTASISGTDGFSVPPHYGQFVLRRATRIFELEASISPAQYQKIVQATTLERLVKSGTFSATTRDHDIFGDRTFPHGNPNPPA